MTIELTKEEKIAVIEQHLKSLEYTIYGVNLDLIEANSVSSVDSALVTNLQNKVADLNAKKTALIEEQDSLN